jgi:CRISPR-associated protein Cas1
MMKKTLYLSQPVNLHVNLGQLQFKLEDGTPKSYPIEDLGVVLLDHPQITVTYTTLALLMQAGAVVVGCDEKRMPCGLMFPLEGNYLQALRMRTQADTPAPMRKRLWQQTVVAKISNQASLLAKKGLNASPLQYWAKEVKTDDSLNHEARAAAYYWEHLFTPLPHEKLQNFRRARDGAVPNHLLNYGYAILRALTTKAIVGAGLHPSLGIHHQNQYNAFCLADDLMEPYRPMVDFLVYELLEHHTQESLSCEITKTAKQHLLALPLKDVWMEGENSPLMVAIQRTATTLALCFAKEKKEVSFPVLRF